MRFYTENHQYYCGIDLHARSMYACILDHSDGEKVVHRQIPCDADRFLQVIEPYRPDVVVGVECLFCWYWVADLCADEDIPFVLGHACAKMGNQHLKWAFSEIAALFLRDNPEGKALRSRLERKHGKGRAMSVLAAKIGRAVYYMLKRRVPFDFQRFVNAD